MKSDLMRATAVVGGPFALLGGNPVLSRNMGIPQAVFAPEGAEATLNSGDIGRAEHILSLLGDDPGEANGEDVEADKGEEQEQPGAEAADAAEDAEVEEPETEEEDGPDTDDEGETEQKSKKDASGPPIDPPASWKADEKETFKTFPRAAQQIIAQNEKRRDDYISKTQQETAESKKAHEADRTAFQNERKTYAENLQALSKVLQTADPILAQYGNADWGALYRANPDKTGEINALKEDVAKRIHVLNQIAAEHQSVQQQLKADDEKARNEKLKEAHKYLSDKLDFWSDDTKRESEQKALFSYLKTEYGFTPEEVSGTTDGRNILLARKAMLYDQLMAQQAALPAKKAKPAQQPTKKILRSQSPSERPQVSQQAQKLKARANRTGRLDDQAAAILASL